MNAILRMLGMARRQGIDTDFAFAQETRTEGLLAQPDLLGPLRGLVGSSQYGRAQRTWVGKGFNTIWRPNHGQSGTKDFFLELNETDETLTFTDITGSGIANRGLLQDDILLGGVAYLQTINDHFDHSGQHFEPGVWINVPPTNNPLEMSTVVRMGTIPHGTTINLQGAALSAVAPQFAPIDITPFTIGNSAQKIRFAEQDLNTPSTSRTPLDHVPTLNQAHIDNLSLRLAEEISGQTILTTTVLTVSSQGLVTPGGGTDNIAFLTGQGIPPEGGPNANAASVQATFWIERVRGENGNPNFDQLQYAQTVNLEFNGLTWPHATIATLRVQ